MMHTQTISAGEELADLISEMDQKYLNSIDTLCSKGSCLLPPVSSDYYSNYCLSLIALAEQHLRLSRISWIPYLLELLDKEDVGHDCRSCSSACTIRHTAQVAGILQSHKEIQASLGLLSAITPPYSKVADEQHQLIQTLANTLAAMISTEEYTMIPLIRQVQEAIHAHG